VHDLLVVAYVGSGIKESLKKYTLATRVEIVPAGEAVPLKDARFLTVRDLG